MCVCVCTSHCLVGGWSTGLIFEQSSLAMYPYYPLNQITRKNKLISVYIHYNDVAV